MRGYRRRRSVRVRFPRFARGFFLFLLFTVAVIWTADRTAAGALMAIAEQEARRRAIDATVLLATSRINRVKPADLVIFEKNQQGQVVAYRVDTAQVNEIAALGAEAVKSEFNQLVGKSFGIPVGDLTGLSFLAGTGPVIPVQLTHTGSIDTNLRQEFLAAGINQTRHRIWLEATVSVRIVLPIASKEIDVTSDIPITDTVIVGPVPSSFVNGSLGGVTLPTEPTKHAGG